VLRVVRLLDHAETRLCAETERAFLRTLGPDCRLPAGAYARFCGYLISIEGMLDSQDETLIRKKRVSGTNPKVGSVLAKCLREHR